MRRVKVGCRAYAPSPSARSAMAVVESRRAITEKHGERLLPGVVLPRVVGTVSGRSPARWLALRPNLRRKTTDQGVASLRRECCRKAPLRRALLQVCGQLKATARGQQGALRHAGRRVERQPHCPTTVVLRSRRCCANADGRAFLWACRRGATTPRRSSLADGLGPSGS